MHFAFGLKSSLLLIFFVHGWVFSSLLLIKGIETSNKSCYWLSFFTFLCTLYIAPFMFGYAGWYAKDGYRDVLFYIPFQQLFLLPPVLYFYFRTLLDRTFIFSRKDWIHFVPAALYLLYSLVVFVTDKLILQDYYFYADGKDKDLDSWYQVAGFFSLLFYLIQSLRFYLKYKQIAYEQISFAESVLFKWAKRFLIAFLLLLSSRLLFFVINPEWDQFGNKFWYYTCFSILFYYISISGYVNSIRSYVSFADTKAVETPEPENFPSTVLPDLETWKEKIAQLMEKEKLFENPELTLAQLCTQLGIHSKKASQLINQGFNMNFNDFVNHFRTKAVIGKLEQGKHHTQTLISIAYECGFNSKSTFNRAFKSYTSTTPKEYIENLDK